MPIVNVNGAKLYYFERGQGTPLIFIHPPVIDSLVFSYQIAQLSRHFRTIVFDIQGHGRSEAKAASVTYTTIADDAIGLMDELGIDKGVFCGYSTGAAVVLECLLRHPNRALAGVLMGGMSEVRHLWLKALLIAARAASRNWSKRLLALAVALVNTGELKYFVKQYRRSLHGDPQKWGQYFGASQTYNCTDELSKIETPVLMIYGEKDRRFHPYAQQISALLPRRKLIFLPNAPHQMPTKSYVSVSSQIEQFLAEELKL